MQKDLKRKMRQEARKQKKVAKEDEEFKLLEEMTRPDKTSPSK